MKIGVSDFAFPADWSAQQIFSKARQVGFDGVELGLTENGIVNLSSTKEDMLSVKALAEENGISLYSLACNLYWNNSLTASNPSVREKARSILRKQLELAEHLGCDTILVVPGAVGVDFIPNHEVQDYDVVYASALAWMQEIKSEAEARKVSIAIENVGNKFLLSPLEMREFIDKANSDYVGAYFDVGNIMSIGYPDQWIRLLGKRIRKIHIKDYSRKDKRSVNLLEGDVDFSVVMSALRQTSYDGWLTAEYLLSPEEFESGIQKIYSAMQQIANK